jgi:hypothetical protein
MLEAHYTTVPIHKVMNRRQRNTLPFLAPTEYTECHAFFSVVSSESGPPTHHPQGSVAPPPFGSTGGDTLACGGRHTRLRGMGLGDPIPTHGQTLRVLYVYYNPLHAWTQKQSRCMANGNFVASDLLGSASFIGSGCNPSKSSHFLCSKNRLITQVTKISVNIYLL